MRDRDADRFKLLLLTPAELRDLGLDDQQAKDLASKLANTASGYEQLLRTQKVVEKDAQWLNFGGTRPGIVPAGTDGRKKTWCIRECGRGYRECWRSQSGDYWHAGQIGRRLAT